MRIEQFEPFAHTAKFEHVVKHKQQFAHCDRTKAYKFEITLFDILFWHFEFELAVGHAKLDLFEHKQYIYWQDSNQRGAFAHIVQMRSWLWSLENAESQIDVHYKRKSQLRL